MKTIRFFATLSFTINVNGPGVRRWHGFIFQHNYRWRCLLSLLVGYIAWLATAYRDDFSRNLGCAQHEFELFCQPLL